MSTQIVQMRGTKDGFVVQIDDQCSFADVLDALETFVKDERITTTTTVKVHLGYRYCSEEKIQQIEDLFNNSPHLTVSEYDSYVVSKELCKTLVEKIQAEKYIGIVRSGQIVSSKGDLIIVGDVNPMGKVEAVGNIYILGELKGAAHAGVEGDTSAVIVASIMRPTHLSIANELQLMGDAAEQDLQFERMECVYLVDGSQMKNGELHELRMLRPELMTRLGGINHG